MNELKSIGNILIKDNEIEILKKHGIIINNSLSIDEVLLMIDMYLNETLDITNEEYDELDYVASTLMERKYYMETNK